MCCLSLFFSAHIQEAEQGSSWKKVQSKASKKKEKAVVETTEEKELEKAVKDRKGLVQMSVQVGAQFPLAPPRRLRDATAKGNPLRSPDEEQQREQRHIMCNAAKLSKLLQPLFQQAKAAAKEAGYRFLIMKDAIFRAKTVEKAHSKKVGVSSATHFLVTLMPGVKNAEDKKHIAVVLAVVPCGKVTISTDGKLAAAERMGREIYRKELSGVRSLREDQLENADSLKRQAASSKRALFCDGSDIVEDGAVNTALLVQIYRGDPSPSRVWLVKLADQEEPLFAPSDPSIKEQTVRHPAHHIMSASMFPSHFSRGRRPRVRPEPSLFLSPR